MAWSEKIAGSVTAAWACRASRKNKAPPTGARIKLEGVTIMETKCVAKMPVMPWRLGEIGRNRTNAGLTSGPVS
jgi:hypothetical protein